MAGWTATEWTALGSVLAGAGTLVGALAVIMAAWLGSRTFESWRRQALSERRIAQAERILAATYTARRGLSRVRSPAEREGEHAAAREHLAEQGEMTGSDIEVEHRVTAEVYYARLHSVREARQALEDCQPMARAFFGAELESAMGKLNRQFQDVANNVGFRYLNRDGLTLASREKMEAKLWSGYPSPEENEMDKIIAELVKVIEDICVPVLRLKQ